jgi:hypothetical protein
VRVHRPETQTLYAQLFEATATYEVDLLGEFANGLAIERTVRARNYLYWQLRDVNGRLRQVYLGAADDPSAQALRDALVSRKQQRGAILEDLERLSAAYVASGGAVHIGTHFKVVDALARAGLFRAGAVLVGSHAFVSLGAALGVTWAAAEAGTADIDLCKDEFVSVACEELQPIDIPGVLKTIDPTFFLVPELDWKSPSTSMSSRRGVKVDLLTTAKTPRDTRPRSVAPFGLSAQPLRHMDFLVRDDVTRGLFIGPHAIMINVPHPGRFAIHKLAISTRRSGGGTIKADKDRRQAAALALALADRQPGALEHAIRAARRHHDRGLLRDASAARERLPSGAREVLSL